MPRDPYHPDNAPEHLEPVIHRQEIQSHSVKPEDWIKRLQSANRRILMGIGLIAAASGISLGVNFYQVIEREFRVQDLEMLRLEARGRGEPDPALPCFVQIEEAISAKLKAALQGGILMSNRLKTSAEGVECEFSFTLRAEQPE